MIRLCLNCHTENPVDAVLCSECGMSLTRAPTGETAEKARSVAGVRDTTNQEAKEMLVLALVGMGCWTTLVLAATSFLMFISLVSAGGVTAGQPEMAWLHNNMSFVVQCGGPALALAPWVVGGIVLRVRWRNSRASEGPEDTEQDAG
jgi:ribosomal protein L40E